MSEEQQQGPPSAPERGPSGHHHGHSHLPAFTFLEELKRRNVGRVAILYIILGYVVLEVFGVFVHLLNLPPWVGRSAVLLVALGFPVALLIAWIYEITPEGLKPTHEVAPHQSIRHLTGRRLDRAIIAVLAIALSYFVIDKFWLSHRSGAPTSITTAVQPATAAIPEKSVAVLPFLDMSEKHDQEYLADGLAEELINLLTRVPDLRVPARTSSFYFKDKHSSIAYISRALSVAYVLEGSVRKSGDRLRVTCQLIRADDGYHVWSTTFDRNVEDVFVVQDEIASAVASALSVTLGEQDTIRPASKASADAHDSYLQGEMALRGATTRPEIENAIVSFRAAVNADPQYVDGWLGLVQAFNNALLSDTFTPQEVDPEMRRAAREIARLAPNSLQAHLSSGFVRKLLDHNYPGAATDFSKAAKVAPNDPTALRQYADVLSDLGHFDQFVGDLIERSINLDPFSPRAYWDLVSFYMSAGRYGDAERALGKVRALTPNDSQYFLVLGEILVLDHRPAEAIAVANNVDDVKSRHWVRALAFSSMGRTGDANAEMAAIEKAFDPSDAYGLALLNAYMERSDRAFSLLDDSRKAGSYMFDIRGEPLLNSLHKDARWNKLLKELNLLDSSHA